MNVEAAVAAFGAMSQVLMTIVFDDQFDSDDENDSDDNQEKEDVVRIQGYINNIVPDLTDTQFQGHFRVTREAFGSLMGMIGPMLRRDDGFGRPTIDPVKQSLSVLWLLATPDSYRSVGERFDMGKSSLFVSFERVVNALCTIASQVISWPREARRPAIKAAFERMGGIPDVLGAIDGTFIPIKAPTEHPEVWVTRKCNYAMTLQAICDSELRFTDVFVGYPGSVSDTRIFRNSDIYNNVTRNRETYFGRNDLIVADCAYPVLEWCIPPYVNRGNLTQDQRHFNHRLSQTRQTVERSFGLLFGRYRRLKFLDMNRMDLVPATILAACVLHNVCLDHDDALLQEYEDDGREFLQQGDGLQAENVVAGFNRDVRGEQRRDDICRMLNQL